MDTGGETERGGIDCVSPDRFSGMAVPLFVRENLGDVLGASHFPFFGSLGSEVRWGDISSIMDWSCNVSALRRAIMENNSNRGREGNVRKGNNN